MDHEEQQQRADLLSRMFAGITAKLEDAATIAARCQGRVPTEELRENANQLRDLLSESATVVEGASALIP
ncbi:MAG TPA: hypothetical protein VHG29_03835 [Novosphingobium sp.]|nr:hypothetical protein [Novosphingobium sp.]